MSYFILRASAKVQKTLFNMLLIYSEDPVRNYNEPVIKFGALFNVPKIAILQWNEIERTPHSGFMAADHWRQNNRLSYGNHKTAFKCMVCSAGVLRYEI